MKDNDKIKQCPTRKIKTGIFNNKNKLAEIKNFLGFEYVKLKNSHITGTAIVLDINILNF